MYSISLDSVIIIALAPFVLVPAMLAIFTVLETAGRINGWFIVRRFRLAAENIDQGEAFAEILAALGMEIDMAQAVHASSLRPVGATLLPELELEEKEEEAEYEDIFPGQRYPCGEYLAVTPNVLRAIDPATKARAVEDLDDTDKHRAIQYPTPFQKLSSSPFYFDASMLAVGQLVSGCITIR